MILVSAPACTSAILRVVKRYALVGTGDRGLDMFARPILTIYSDVAELVGLHDVNPLRVRAARDLLGRPDLPAFDSFGSMLEHAHPDVVIVASKDSTHRAFIVEAMRAGCDVVTEKPMTIDDASCREILATERETGRELRVAFNYRYAPYFTKAKELLAAGAIGDVRSVDFHWYLDTDHGADYFRRWHRRMENSGGLFVHKATHHFDLVNWWVADRPEAVLASGSLLFYGPTRQERGERCMTCAYADTCEFHWDVADDDLFRRLYVDAEAGDGYHRDGCVFDPAIDIYDTMTAIVRYERGITMSYSLNAYAAYEGVRAAFNGTTGRLELERIESRHLPADEIRIYRFLREEPEDVISVPRVADDEHGGGDRRLLDHLLRGAEDDPLGHAAGSLDGAYSVLTGVAANRSVDTGTWVRIADLL